MYARHQLFDRDGNLRSRESRNKKNNNKQPSLFT